MSSLFLKLPLPARKLAVVIKGAQYRRIRYGRSYKEMLRLLRGSENWTREQMDDYQRKELARLLIEAKSGTRHFGNVLASYTNGDLEELASLGKLDQIPILPKNVLKEATSAFFNENRSSVFVSKTSGTTGSPMQVEYDAESMQQRFAYFHRHREWAGLMPFGRTVHFSGHHFVAIDRPRPPYWMANPFEHQLLVSTYHLKPQYLGAICKRIQDFRPALVHGYPSAIAVVARFARDQGLAFPSLRAVMTTAETMEPEIREEIESGLGAQVYDYYSASEGAPIAQECQHGRMHLRPESGIFEILSQDGQPVECGEIGEFVVTSFVQWRTPLIRYRTGDMAVRVAEDEVCECGRSLPLIGKVLGRYEDLVYTRDGQWMGLFSHRIFKGVRGVRESQVVQHSMDSFSVKIVGDGTRLIDEIRTELEIRFGQVLSYAVDVQIREVATIPRGSNGKYRTVKRDFEPDKL